MISGILALLGGVILLKSFSIEDFGSCPSITPGEHFVCQHTFPGTNLYVSTVWLILDSLSAFCFGAAAVVFLASSRYERRRKADSTRALDEVFGIALVSITAGLTLGAVILPAIYGYPYVRITGLLFGMALGITLGAILYLLPHRNVVPGKPEMS